MSELSEGGLIIEVALLRRAGIGPNGLVGVGIDLLEHVSLDAVLDVSRELLLVELRVLLLQLVHVLRDGLAEDLIAMLLRVVLLVLAAVAIEASVLVRNVQTAVVRSLQHCEHARSRRRATQTHIQVAAERTLLAQLRYVVRLLLSLAGLHLTVHLLVALVHLSHAQLRQQTTSHQQTRAVRGSVVRQTQLHSVARELSRGSSTQHTVTSDISRNNLGNHLVVGDAHHQTVLGGVVLVLRLDDQSLTGIVIGLTL